MVYIYVLKLQQNKYYIGKTNNPQYRIEDHVNSQGSSWTVKYPPTNIHQIIPDCDEFDEDKYTIKYMKEKGIDNVRGGSFCEINLSVENCNTIQRMINGSTDKCYKCGLEGHFVNDCKVKLGPQKNSVKTIAYQCSFCNKKFDTEKGAKFHENVYCKKKNQKYEDEDEYNNRDITCRYCATIFDTKKRKTEHENKYCRQKHNKKNNQNKDKNKCHRCGRSGHYANNCYAKTDADGDYIDSDDSSDDSY